MAAACPSEDVVLGYFEARLAPELLAEIDDHIDACPTCRHLLRLLARGSSPPLDLEATRDADVTPPTTPDLASLAAAPLLAGGLARGASIGRYIILDVLGAGGMGVVYAALDPELDRKVAVKVLRPDVWGERAAARLRREGRAIARLAHPNVVTVFDVGSHAGSVFVAMELVDGERLDRWLTRERSWREVVEVFFQAGAGLVAAHAAGVIHRDFKPANVLIGGDGRVRVTDFGLARIDAPARLPSPAVATSESVRITRTGAIAGTPAYMAPEQFEASSADEKSDQFSFAVALYEGLYGTRPYRGETADAIYDEIVKGAIAPPPETTVPAWVNGVVVRGLRAAPGERFPTLADLLAALRAEPAPARRRIGRRLGIGLLALGALAASASVVARRASRVSTWSPHIVDVLPQAQENGGQPSFSPDGKWLAYTSDREKPGSFAVYVMPAAGGESRRISPPGTMAHSPRWTRDGKALLYGRIGEREIVVVRHPLDGAPETVVVRGGTPDDCGDAMIYYGLAPPALMLRAADGTSRELLRVEPPAWLDAPRCDRSGQYVVFTHGTGYMNSYASDVYVIDRVGQLRQLTHDAAAGTAAFAPDGRSVIYSAERDGQRHLFEVSVDGGPSQQLTFDDGWDAEPDVSADGTRVVFDRDTTALLPVVSDDRGDPRKLSSTRGTIMVPRATLGGDQLVGARAERNHWNVVAIRTLDGSERVLARGFYPFPSRDGLRVYFRAADDVHRLDSVSIDGGAVSSVARLPGVVLFGVDGADGLHVAVARDGGAVSFRVDRDGRVVDEQVNGLVIPAPAGGWRVVDSVSSLKRLLRLVPPGAELERGDQIAASSMPTWIDDHHLGYCNETECRIEDITTRAVTWSSAIPKGVIDPTTVMVAPDGKHWYGVMADGYVTRHVLTNFADRPWK